MHKDKKNNNELEHFDSCIFNLPIFKHSQTEFWPKLLKSFAFQVRVWTLSLQFLISSIFKIFKSNFALFWLKITFKIHEWVTRMVKISRSPILNLKSENAKETHVYLFLENTTVNSSSPRFFILCGLVFLICNIYI